MKSLDERGVSAIVGEVMLIGIITVAMMMIAGAVISSVTPQERFYDLIIRLENGSDPPTNLIKVILYHMGGDTIGIPLGPDKEFKVVGFKSGATTWENEVPWDNWVFSDTSEGFGIGENAVGYLYYEAANENIGNKIVITIFDYYSDKVSVRESVEIENSMPGQ